MRMHCLSLGPRGDGEIRISILPVASPSSLALFSFSFLVFLFPFAFYKVIYDVHGGIQGSVGIYGTYMDSFISLLLCILGYIGIDCLLVRHE